MEERGFIDPALRWDAGRMRIFEGVAFVKVQRSLSMVALGGNISQLRFRTYQASQELPYLNLSNYRILQINAVVRAHSIED